MICKFCGYEMAEGEVFCEACGMSATEPDSACAESLEEPAERMAADGSEDSTAELALPAESSHADGLRKFLGVMLIVFAALPYILPMVADNFSSSIVSALMYSQEHYSVVNAIKTIMGYVENTFYFTACMASLAAGIVLLQKSRGAARLARVSFVINAVCVAFCVLMAAVVYLAPGMLVGMIGGGASHRQIAESIVSEVPLVLLYLFNKTMWHFAASLILCVLYLAVQKKARSRWQEAGLYEKSGRGLGSVLMILPFIAIMRTFVSVIDQSITFAESNIAGSIFSIVTSLVNSTFGIYIVAAAAIGAAAAVIGRKAKLWKVCTLYTVFIAAAAAAALSLAENFALIIVRAYGMSMEYFAPVTNTFIAYTATSALMVIAFTVWMAASAKGAFAVWIQPLLAVLYMVIFAALELVRPMTGLAFYIQLGCFGAAVVMIAVSCVAAAMERGRHPGPQEASEEPLFDGEAVQSEPEPEE